MERMRRGAMRGFLHAVFISVIFAMASAPGAQAATVNAPGPSAELFKHPYYTCVTNYYVSATGSDSSNGTSTTTPWLTLQHANDSLPANGAAAGSCVNVTPGTY